MAKRNTATAQLCIGEFTFQMDLPSVKTPLGKPGFEDSDLERLRRAAATWIIENGKGSKETFRFLRGIAKLTQEELGKLLSSDKYKINRWENGEHEFSPETWKTIVDLARDQLIGRSDTKEQLSALRKPKSF